MRRTGLLFAFWIIDLALAVAALVLRPLGIDRPLNIDIILHSTYYVISLLHLIVAVCVLFTIPLAVISIWRLARSEKRDRGVSTL